jgi:2-dehydropantoate 2-reductase
VCQGVAMRFIVYGAGAVGGVVGALLAEAGEDVVLIARGPHAEAIRRSGLLLETPVGSRVIRTAVTEDPAGAGVRNGDVVLLGMKSQGTVSALEELRQNAPPSTAVVCLQNGVNNERAALRLFPNVYGVCVMCPCSHLEPGVVQASSHPIPGLLDIGRYPGGIDEMSGRIAAAFRGASFESVDRPDIMRWKYRKLLMNLGNSVEAVCRKPVEPELRRRVIEEGVACLRQAGIEFVSEEEDAARRGDRLNVQPVEGQLRDGGSSWQSLERKAGSIESDYLNGEIVLLGRTYGVPTPVNALLQRLAEEMAASGAAPRSLAMSEFWDRLGDDESGAQ